MAGVVRGEEVEKKVRKELRKEADKVKTDPNALAKIRQRIKAGERGNGKKGRGKK
jgi:hypothetical protein